MYYTLYNNILVNHKLINYLIIWQSIIDFKLMNKNQYNSENVLYEANECNKYIRGTSSYEQGLNCLLWELSI